MNDFLCYVLWRHTSWSITECPLSYGVAPGPWSRGSVVTECFILHPAGYEALIEIDLVVFLR